MVLSLLSQMPPTSTPRTIKESLAKLADNIDKLELVVKRLAASTANLVSITSQTTFTTNKSNTRLETSLQKLICQPTITKKESNDSTSNTNTDISETTTEVLTETSSLATNINKPNNTMANLITDYASSIAKIETEVVTHIPLSPLSGLHANPTHKKPELPHDIAILHRTTLNDTYGHAPLIASINTFDDILELKGYEEAFDMEKTVGDFSVISYFRTVTRAKVDAIAWWIDSGATTHVCKYRCWFKTYKPVEDGSVLYIGDDHFAPVHGKGSVVLEFSYGKSITLFNVLYVPKLRKNLISGPVLNKCGYKQVYESDKYILSKFGVFVGFGYYNNGIFMLNLNKVPDDSGSVYMSSSTVVNSSLWHARLGHVQSSHDSPLSGDHTSKKTEGGLNLEELFVLCTNLSNRVLALETSKDSQVAEILKLKDQIKKLKRKCKPSISHHRAWLKSVQRLSMKKRLGRKESVSKQGRKNAKPEPTLDGFDDLDADGKDYVITNNLQKRYLYFLTSQCFENNKM
ncbi:hypothetical protein Tco_0408961 [Tanacetum coccineum]